MNKIDKLTITQNDLNTYSAIASIAGLIISIITLIVTTSVKTATRKLQNSLAFDKRVPRHLSQINLLLSEFNILYNDIERNLNGLKVVLTQLKTELQSLSKKITDDENKRLIGKTIKGIERNLNKEFVFTPKRLTFIQSLFKVNEENYWDDYTNVGEVHRAIDNLYKDKRITIKT